MSTLSEALSINLKRLIAEKGITQTDLGKSLGVTVQTINAYVNGKTGVSTDMLAKLAKELGVEETDLVAVHKPAEKVELPKGAWDDLQKLLAARDPLVDLISRLDAAERAVLTRQVKMLLADKEKKPSSRSG